MAIVNDIFSPFVCNLKKNARGGVGAIGRYIYFNDQQMDDLVRKFPSSDGVYIQRNIVGLGGFIVKSITIPSQIISSNVKYSFSGIVDPSGNVQDFTSNGYAWRPGSVFYRYAIGNGSSNKAGNVWNHVG